MTKRKVVVTGAAGYVAGRMLSALRQRYDLTLLDIKTTGRDGEVIEGIHVTDLLHRDRDTYRSYFQGADAVVHCGFTRAGRPEDRYWAEADNVNMAHNVYQTCVEEDVRRVVVISSNHAADYYEQLIWTDRMEFVTPDMLPLSDNYYGWAKAAYELLGFAFATGGVNGGRKLEVVQLTVKSIEAEHIEDEHGIPFQIFYGVSGNTHNFWSLANARKIIGYTPEDNSQIRFADKIAKIMAAAQETSSSDS
jgi:uronate dehydrogenase